MVKNLPANTGDIRDTGLISGSGRSPEGGNGNPLQYFCLENLVDRGALQAAVHKVAQSQAWLKWLSRHTSVKSSLQSKWQTTPIVSLCSFKVKRQKTFLPYVGVQWLNNVVLVQVYSKVIQLSMLNTAVCTCFKYRAKELSWLLFFFFCIFNVFQAPT